MTNEHHLQVELALELRYKHGFGSLSPFLRLLGQGRALASRCNACGDVRFPPRRVCLHDSTDTAPHELSGSGCLVRATTGEVAIPLTEPAQILTFGEIAMDGADNRVLARLRGDPAQIRPGARVRLAPPEGQVSHPIQALVFEPI